MPAVSVHDGSILEQNVPFFLELNDANFNYDTAQGSALSTDFGGSSAEILPFWCFGMVGKTIPPSSVSLV